ncbi:MAG: DUF2254 domain-containing protein [Acidimicrobiales bacterium]
MKKRSRLVPPISGRSSSGLPSWRREELLTTLWLVPAALTVAAVVLFVVTYELDLAASHHHLTLPGWIHTLSPSDAREVLSAVAAAVITVVGLVFSITILALTLATQQFGPRMMRNFVRDVGNQITLGVWVATFVYAVLTLGAISGSSTKTFVPDISITVTEVLLIADVVVLIYFIHHIAKSIQLPEVVASIATDLFNAIDAEFPEMADDSLDSGHPLTSRPVSDDADERSVDGLCRLLETQGATVPAGTSGYLQFVGYGQLVNIAEDAGAVIRLSHRTGHFIVAGRPLARVWPPKAAAQVAVALDKSHVTGPHRTLIQDPVFAIDQLVEIGIRALSPAVNDTFTALTCIDWISAGLCRISTRKLAEGVYRDRTGEVRLIEFDPSYPRMVNRAVDKIRQASAGMPAVVIRLIDSLTYVIGYTTSSSQRAVIIRQAEMIMRAAERDIVEPNDLDQIRGRFEALIAVSEERETTGSAQQDRSDQDRRPEDSPSVI